MQVRATMLAATIVAALLLTFPSTHEAQAQPALPVPRGDIVWTFAQENPLFDSRITAALGTLMAPKIDVAAAPAPRIVRVEQREPGIFAPSGTQQASDVPKLLAAAGYGGSPPFVEVGQCRIWAAESTTGTSIPPAKAVLIIAPALRESLASLGVQTQTCTMTTNAAEAHVLVWVSGDTTPALAQRGQATFLSGSGSTSAPGSPRPAVTGNAGVEAPSHRLERDAAALLIAMALLVIGARLLPRRRRGHS